MFHAEYFGVVDEKGYPPTGQNQGGEELKANGFLQLPDGFHGALSVDYLSSYIFRLAFAQSFTEAINSEVRSNGYVYRDRNGYSLDYLVARYQDYQSEAPGDVIDIAHLSTFEFSSLERPFSRSRLMYSYDFAVEALSRHETRLSDRTGGRPPRCLSQCFAADVSSRLDLPPGGGLSRNLLHPAARDRARFIHRGGRKQSH